MGNCVGAPVKFSSPANTWCPSLGISHNLLPSFIGIFLLLFLHAVNCIEIIDASSIPNSPFFSNNHFLNELILAVCYYICPLFVIKFIFENSAFGFILFIIPSGCFFNGFLYLSSRLITSLQQQRQRHNNNKTTTTKTKKYSFKFFLFKYLIYMNI